MRLEIQGADPARPDALVLKAGTSNDRLALRALIVALLAASSGGEGETLAAMVAQWEGDEE